MHNPFDQLAKKVGKEALEACGSTVVQYEISGDAQHADLRHDPDPVRDAERARLGLLGRIAAVLCLIEIYGHAPSGAEIRACLGKHFAHWAECERKARARNRRRILKNLPREPFAEPRLWIIAAGASASMLRKLEVKTAPTWPAGVYFHGDDLYRVGIVVANELPRDRSTLLVRLMAAGPVLAEAIADLAALPDDAHERAVAEQILLHLRHVIGKKAGRTPEEEEFIVSMHGTWKEARAEGRSEGRTEGRTEGRIEGDAFARARNVLTVLRARGLAVSDAVRERILAEKDPERLERWLERSVVAASVSDVLD
ncbi:MAG: hypothetical protein ABJE95_23970 [Byssovorax sp.]